MVGGVLASVVGGVTPSVASTAVVRIVAVADVAILQVLLLLAQVDGGADAAGRYAPSSVVLTCCR